MSSQRKICATYVLIGELSDLHSATIGKNGTNLQVCAHGLQIACERADIHIRTSFQFGNISLPNVQIFRDHGLGQFAGLSQLMQGHLLDESAVRGFARHPGRR